MTERTMTSQTFFFGRGGRSRSSPRHGAYTCEISNSISDASLPSPPHHLAPSPPYPLPPHPPKRTAPEAPEPKEGKMMSGANVAPGGGAGGVRPCGTGKTKGKGRGPRCLESFPERVVIRPLPARRGKERRRRLSRVTRPMCQVPGPPCSCLSFRVYHALAHLPSCFTFFIHRDSDIEHIFFRKAIRIGH